MNKLDKIFESSKRINIDDNTKLVIMSDCHRGIGNNLDNFLKNKNIYQTALNYYYNNNFTYIELGDGDDMWEVKDCKEIVESYLDIFKQLKKFYDSNRLIMIYGNHDMTKKHPNVLENCFYKYYDKITKKDEDLLNGLTVYESLVLIYKNYDIFLIHGHQGDFLNSTLWRLSRFLVRNVWVPLENIGIKSTTGSAKNYGVTKNTEEKLKNWSAKNNKMIITGHTHKPIFPIPGKGLYFNDGSCIHPNGITCLEIEKGIITLVRWEFKATENGIISVDRQILDSEYIINFFK